MTFEQLQSAWKTQAIHSRDERDVNLLLTEVRRNARTFEALIWRRDILEVGTCFAMSVGFGVWGYLWQWWSLGVLAAACLFVGGFFVMDRRGQRKVLPQTRDDLKSYATRSLAQLNHQIWLLKNIFWWYLLPVLLGISTVIGQIVWHHREEGGKEILTLGITLAAVYAFTFGFIFWVNQWTVRNKFEPRRKELELLLKGLE